MMASKKKGEILTGAKRREWMGCWGLLGLSFMTMDWIIPSFLAFSTRKVNRTSPLKMVVSMGFDGIKW